MNSKSDATMLKTSLKLLVKEVLISLPTEKGDEYYDISRENLELLRNYVKKELRVKEFEQEENVDLNWQVFKLFLEENDRVDAAGVVEECKKVVASIPAQFKNKILYLLFNSFNDSAFAKELFNLSVNDGSYSIVSETLKKIAHISGGSGGSNIGMGEFALAFLFPNCKWNGVNSEFDISTEEKNWHVKKIDKSNVVVRMGTALWPQTLTYKRLNDAKVFGNKEVPTYIGQGTILDHYNAIVKEFNVDDKGPVAALKNFQDLMDKDVIGKHFSSKNVGIIFFDADTDTFEIISSGFESKVHSAGATQQRLQITKKEDWLIKSALEKATGGNPVSKSKKKPEADKRQLSLDLNNGSDKTNNGDGR